MPKPADSSVAITTCLFVTAHRTIAAASQSLEGRATTVNYPIDNPSNHSPEVTLLSSVVAVPATQARHYESVVMIFANEYDIASRAELRLDLERLVDVRTVVLDFTDVTYIDSTVIGELIRLHNLRASRNLPPETIVANNPNLLKLFTIVQLHEAFRIVASLDAAVENGSEPMDLLYATTTKPT